MAVSNFGRRLAFGWMVGLSVYGLVSFGSVSAATTQALPIVTGSGQSLRDVTLRNVKITDGVVSGIVVNNTRNQLKNVDLMFRYGWMWKHEFAPGTDNPGWAVVRTVDGISPGGEFPFTYSPESPLPVRSDGHFEISVIVAGFTQFR
jgi:hypothetical protein